MRHIQNRLEERGISIDLEIINRMVNRCDGDVALLLYKFPYIVNDSDLRYCEREISNGDLCYLIVRKRYPVTIMFRRSTQDNCPEKLKVGSVADIREIVKNYVIK